jgi:NAD(P)-dependent dehydrogenase (short-subunit alcohol dehydrogenase family)
MPHAPRPKPARINTRLAEFVPHRFEGEVALVVGGAQGIGKAIAIRMGREGAHVVIADVDKKMLAKTSGEMSAEGSKISSVFCNVRRRTDVERAVRAIIHLHKKIDVLMYVAGVGKVVPFTKTGERHWDWIFETNLKGAFRVARAVAPHMIRRRYGKLLFMASTNSWDAEAGLAPYNASKAGLFLLAKTLARELGQYGICSNAVGPGLIRTRLTAPLLRDRGFMRKYRDLIPVGRLGEPEDVAGPATFLASHDADYVNGVLLFVDGGQLA